MRILVTGACGYKGTVLVPKLLKAGHDVVALDIMWFGNFLEPHPNLTMYARRRPQHRRDRPSTASTRSSTCRPWPTIRAATSIPS